MSKWVWLPLIVNFSKERETGRNLRLMRYHSPERLILTIVEGLNTVSFSLPISRIIIFKRQSNTIHSFCMTVRKTVELLLSNPPPPPSCCIISNLFRHLYTIQCNKSNIKDPWRNVVLNSLLFVCLGDTGWGNYWDPGHLASVAQIHFFLCWLSDRQCLHGKGH